jgi:hypothetical protein
VIEMDAASGMAPPSTGKALGIAFVVAVLFGAIAGYAAGSLASPAYTPPPPPTPQNREFWVFTVILPFNDSRPGFPAHDYFAPDRIVVNLGDNITIHFFNTEDAPENHTFTMEAPYAMNVILPYGHTTTFSFTAKVAGIFPYLCVYHQPSMTGYLVVLA